jgi:hypothetical protein
LYGQTASAQQSCSLAGADYASGAALCQPTLRDGEVAQTLFTCTDGAWTDTGVVCPDQFAYFCRIGPHAVAVGQQLLLGAGPAHLECRFPGIFRLSQESGELTTGITPSVMVRSVQLFLSDEGENLDCAVDDCDGRSDDKTMSAVASYLRKNFASLSPEEQATFGVADEGDIEAAVRAMSPIDVIPLFVRIFDVQLAQ